MAHTAQQSDMHHIGDGTQDDRLVAFFWLIDARKYLLSGYRAQHPTGDYPAPLIMADTILARAEMDLRRELGTMVRMKVIA